MNLLIQGSSAVDAGKDVFNRALDTGLSLGILFLLVALFMYIIWQLWKYYTSEIKRLIALYDAKNEKLTERVFESKKQFIEALRDVGGVMDKLEIRNDGRKDELTSAVENAKQSIHSKIDTAVASLMQK